MFICERAGRLRVLKNGVLLTTPFLTVPVSTSGERGLVGIAFDPNYATNRFLYVYYTVTGGTTGFGISRISRFTASATNPDVAAAGSELILMGDIPNNQFHNSGALHFGPDGMLYFTVGDNTVRNTNPQSLSTISGKIGRINPAAYPNLIPADNPFVSTPGARGEIWAYGLRNSFTFAIDQTEGKIWASEVGEATWEEVNNITRGSNQGWPTCEGGVLLGSTTTPCTDSRFTPPVFFYNHDSAYPMNGCSTIGGAFYHGGNFPPDYEGNFFFTDHCGGNIWRRTPSGQFRLFTNNAAPETTTLIQGPDGAIYAVNHGTGQVYRIAFVGTGNHAPNVIAASAPSRGATPLTVRFDGSSSTDADGDGDALTFDWDFGDGTTGTGATVMHTYTTAGQFTARLTVSDGTTSAFAILTIIAGSAPTAVILTPTEGTRYTAGTNLNFSGSGTSATGQPLPASAFSWTVVFHHDDHTHPFSGPTSGTSGTVAVPTTGELSANVFLRFHLTVTDNGVPSEVTRDVRPNTAMVTLQTSPPGLALSLDGQSVTTPFTFTGVAGVTRLLSAPSPQTVGGVSYQFSSWSDNGSASHAISTPLSNTTFTATFTSGTASPDLIIYGDSLAWSNWSWSTTVNAAATSPVLVGTNSMAVTYNAAWAGLSLCTIGVSTSPYTRLSFAIRPNGTTLPAIFAFFHSAAGTTMTRADIRQFATAAGNGWFRVNIPLSNLGAVSTTISRVNLQSGTAAAQPTFFVDDLRPVVGP